MTDERAPLRTFQQRWVALWLGAVFGILVSRAANASEVDPFAGVALELVAPPDCSTKELVLSQLRDALGAASEPLPSIRANITISAQGSGLTLSYRAWRGNAESRRTLALDTCNEATEASVLLLLLTLDPALAESLGVSEVVEKAGSPAPLPEPLETGQKEVRPESPSQPTNREIPKSIAASPRSVNERRPLIQGVWFGVIGTSCTGVAPKTAFGMGLEGGLRHRPFRLAFDAGWSWSGTSRIDEVADARLDASLLRGHLSAGIEFGSTPYAFGPIASIGMEWLRLKPRQVAGGRPGSTPLLSTTLGAWAGLMLSDHWGILGQGGLLIPLERPTFRIIGLQRPVHTPASVGMDVKIGFFGAWGSKM